MQRSMPVLAFIATNLIISTSYADTKAMDAQTFSNMVKENQQAAQQSASSEASKMTGSQASSPSSSGSGSQSAADQAKNSMNNSNAPAPTTTTPANTAPTTSQPTINPSTSAPADNIDPYSGYTGQSNDKANTGNTKTPANNPSGEQNKGWNLGY